MVPTTCTPQPIRIQARLPRSMPKTAIIMQPSHDANRKTEVIMEVVVVSGYCQLSVGGLLRRRRTVSYSHRTLEFIREEDTAQHSRIPSEGHEAQTASDEGFPVQSFSCGGSHFCVRYNKTPVWFWCSGLWHPEVGGRRKLLNYATVGY
jgi:hypothetical protein